MTRFSSTSTPNQHWAKQHFLTLGAFAGLATIAGLLAMTPPAIAAPWTLVRDGSAIKFSGTHAGRPFDGTFEDWSADVTFDPQALDQSSAVVRVVLNSAVTGDKTYDKTLPSADWFRISETETATFAASKFRSTGDGTFAADGTLTLRQIEVPVTLEFTFTKDGDTAALNGKAKLKRLDWKIGEKSDAGGSWVSLDIPVTVDAKLKRAGP